MDAARVSLSQLFLISDMVIIARIEAVTERSFSLDNKPTVYAVVSARVSSQYKGSALKAVEFFQDAHGHAHYEPGDMAVVFLDELSAEHQLADVGSAAGVSFVSSQVRNTEHRIAPGELADYEWVLASYAEPTTGMIYPAAERSLRIKETLLRMLGSNSTNITESALLDWENIGSGIQLNKEELGYLLALTRDPARPVNLRLAILRSMSRQQLVDNTAWIYLFEHETDENLLPVVRSTQGNENKVFMPYLTRLLDNPHDEVVEGAARAMAHPAYSGAESEIERLLKRKSQRLNYAAVYALVGINSEQARKILLDAEANHPNPKVRRMVSARMNVLS